MNDNEFLWSFPCFLLAKNVRYDATGDVEWHDDLAFKVVGKAGDERILIFTDKALAEEYRESINDNDLHAIPLNTAANFRWFLGRAALKHRLIVVDLNRKTMVGQEFSIEPLLEQLSGQ